MSLSPYFKALLTFAIVIGLGFTATKVSADHTWFNYHWARTSNPFTLRLGDNVSTVWDSHLNVAASDWSLSSVLDTTVARGSTNAKTCKSSLGKVEVCASKYGNNGWLGLATIWVDGDHITKGTVKMNDTYFNTTKYNKPEWRASVMCQEIGHTLGLDHQDEDFNNPNLDTCMDYTSNPLSNQHPNQHDYSVLETIYSHLDLTSTLGSNTSTKKADEIDHDDKSTWGKSIRKSKDGKTSVYVKETNGSKIFTFVVWAE